MGEVGFRGIQYVILENEFDYTAATFADLLQFENVYYYQFPIDSKSWLLRKLYIFHGSQKMNQFFELPGQSVWNRYLFDISALDRFRPVCFVYSFRRIDRIRRSHFLEYVSAKFPHAYHVAYWDDLIRPNHMQALEYAKKNFDLIFSYDEGDAMRYSIQYYPSFYSKVKTGTTQSCEYDVFFIGNAKNRLKDIYVAYERLACEGVNCKFIINNVPHKAKRDYSMVEYNRKLSYCHVLDYVLRSNCILEIVQKGSVGQTLRVNEAVVYNKKLLSNNPLVTELPQFDSRFMHVYSADFPDNIAEFVKSHTKVDYNFDIKNLSPIKFIDAIEKRLGGVHN